jgi:hygromycin-B 7''-O-kinase
VYRLAGRQYLKVFGPTVERQFHVERAVLRTIEHDRAIPAPRIVAEGEVGDGLPYLILTEIPGSTAEVVWDNLSRSEQLALARDFGTISAAIHRLPQQALAAVEQQFGGRREHIQAAQARLSAQIEATTTLSTQRCHEMIRFLEGEAWTYLNGLPKLAHCELAHNHLYLSQESGTWQVTGFIDWADAMIGPPEWDVTFLWFWTFTRDQEAMQHCLQTLYADGQPPAQFARRCLAAILHTHSGPGLWAEFAASDNGSKPIEQAMTEYLFPPTLFGPPD